MTPEQCRAGRAWLAWSQSDLAKAAKVGLSTVKDFEAGKREPIANNRTAIQTALEREGIGFSSVLDGDAKKACGITYSEPVKGNKTVDES
jgi:ribosome-binding protein aMBF1 (putative translation factor)